MKRNLHGHVVHEIGMRIVHGEYAPGVSLPHPDVLGASMNVTGTAIRGAVKALVAKGMV
ncbi:MAG: GntR family transcriptional regulator, partial [Bradyrhizobium sp.]|nr:GntR family transcriptional regulator [Bradyrhizobium sp.]